MMFRMSRTGLKLNAAQDERDWTYYRDQGWFESDFYYPTHLGPFKKTLGALFDWAGAHMPAFKVAKEARVRGPWSDVGCAMSRCRRQVRAAQYGGE